MSLFRRVIKKIIESKSIGTCLLTVEGYKPVKFQNGTILLTAIKEMDVDINYYCGGTCSCGTCFVEIISGENALSSISSKEKMVLGYDKFINNSRLSCQAKLKGDVVIRVPSW